MTFAPQTTKGEYLLVLGPRILDTAGRPLNSDGDLLAGEVPDDQYAMTFDVSIPIPPPSGHGFDFPEAMYMVGIQPYSVTAADFDNDGAVDLVTANYNDSGTVSVLLNSRRATDAPRIISCEPRGLIKNPLASVRVTFNRPMDTLSFSLEDDIVRF